jgi:hypothetical protein
MSQRPSLISSGSAPPPMIGSTPGHDKSRKSLNVNIDNKYVENIHTTNIDHGSETDFMEVLRQKIKKYMINSTFGQTYDNFLLFLSVVSCFEYIYQTYLHTSIEEDRGTLRFLNSIELVFASVFGFDWCLNCFVAEHRVLFFTRFVQMGTLRNLQFF